jgi:alpha-glutamyl/putrescinyl thymine pyrophosphorylase clade 1
MIARDIFAPDQLGLFWSFIAERQQIWVRRFVQGLSPPWTTDPILKQERFTNVYRELDPGTVYAVEHILEVEAPEGDRIFNVMLYRLIGRSETHAALGFQRVDDFDPDLFVGRLRWMRTVCGRSPFTAAYMVSGYSEMGSTEKAVNVARLLAGLAEHFDLFHTALRSSRSAAGAYERIRSEHGFGNFLAYQILVDLLYSLRTCHGRPLLPFSHDDWASAGPGAQRGIHMLLRPGVRTQSLEVMRWLRTNQHEEFVRHGIVFPYLVSETGEARDISLANIQNCLCEFHKYVKIQSRTGRGRRKFVPTVGVSLQLPIGVQSPA